MKCVIKRAARDIFAVLMTMIARVFAASLRASTSLIAGLTSVLLAACGPVDGRDEVAALGPLESPYFAVSDFFTPSGQMGDGAKAGFITMNTQRSCGVRGMCYGFDYKPGTNLWAGVYWVYPSNNWGSRNGRRFKPWRFVKDPGATVGTFFQRYNQVQFRTRVSQDTFRIDLTGTDSTGKVYTLRNAVFQVDGPSQHTVTGNWYLSPMPGSHATLAMNPGEYSITLQPGWTLESMEMGMPVAAVADLPVNPVEVAMFNRDAPASSAFDFQVGGERVRFSMYTPPIAVEYYAGSIGDTAVLRIACPEPGTRCEHRDTISSSSSQRKQLIGREWMNSSIGLLLAPPCVRNNAGDEPSFANRNTGILDCPVGSANLETGYIAMCDGAFQGAVNADAEQSVTCCATGDPIPDPAAPGMWTCADPAQVIPGLWQHANDIQSWIIGGFGWAMNYSEFEAQKALIISNGGQAPNLDNLPSTSIHLNDIVWNFVTTP